MSRVLTEHVRSALAELSDLDYQSRVWTGHGGAAEMSSFAECVERLFGDSGLDLALDNGEAVFGSPVDDELRELGDLVMKIETVQDPDALLRHPRMRCARNRAATILREIDEGASGASR